MSGWRILRTATIPICVVLSLGVYAAWYTADFFPWLHVAAVTAVALVVGLNARYDSSPRQLGWSLAMVGLVGATLRAPMVLFPGTLSSNDPEKYALLARLTLESGSYRIPSVSFYGVAGGFHTYVAQIAAVAGVTPETAMVSVGVLFGVWGPLLAAACCVLTLGRTPTGAEAGVVAAAITAVAALSIRISYIPIAQSLGTILFLTFVWASMRHLRLDDPGRRTNWVVLTVLLLGMAFTHKLPVIIASALLIGGWVATRITTIERVWPWEPSRSHLPSSLVLMATLVAVIQQTYVTTYVSRAFHHAQSTTGASMRIPQRLGTEPDAATVVDTGALVLFESHSHAPVTLAVAGVAWVVLSWVVLGQDADGDRAVPIVLLVAVAGLTSLVLVGVGGGVVSGAPNPMRFQVLQEPLLAALIAIAFVVVRDAVVRSERTRARLHAAFLAIVLVLVAFHALTVVGAPDYPGQERQHLTEEEVTAKEFAAEYVETTVWTDDRLQRQTPSRNDVTDKQSPWVELGQPPRETKFAANNLQLLQGTATDAGFETLLYRSEAEIIGSVGTFRDYRYRLTWDVERAADERYHRVYDNGDAITYRHPAS